MLFPQWPVCHVGDKTAGRRGNRDKGEMQMAEDVKTFFEEFQRNVGKMKEEVPEVVTGFMGLFEKVMKDGALAVKEKELIALGIAVGVQCIHCINLHVKKCLHAGASRAEILEAASVAVMMGGGPAFTHVTEVVKVLDALGA